MGLLRGMQWSGHPAQQKTQVVCDYTLPQNVRTWAVVREWGVKESKDHSSAPGHSNVPRTSMLACGGGQVGHHISTQWFRRT